MISYPKLQQARIRFKPTRLIFSDNFDIQTQNQRKQLRGALKNIKKYKAG